MKTRFLLVASLVILGGILHATVFRAADAQTVSTFKIELSLDRSENRVDLACSEGCAWETASFKCAPGASCIATIDGYGIVTPVGSQ